MDDLALAYNSTESTVIMSSADATFFALLRDLVSSVRHFAPTTPIGVFDLGLRDDQRGWLKAQNAVCLRPTLHCGLSARYDQPLLLGTLVKAFLPEYLPGFDFYIWLDADTWIQRGEVLSQLTSGALSKGMAVVHESDPAYRLQFRVSAWTWKRAAQAFGLRSAIRQRWHRQINSGVYCIRNGAPQWRLFSKCFGEAIRRTGTIWPYDQFALNEAIYREGAEALILEAEHNWICARAAPAWDQERKIFVTPLLPHRPISIIHLAGPAKSAPQTVPIVGGGVTARWLTLSGRPGVPSGCKSVEKARPVDTSLVELPN